jgi:hypothetical protein
MLVVVMLLGMAPAQAQEDPHLKAREAWIARLTTDLTLTPEQVKGLRGVLETLKPGELAGGAAAGDGAAAAERRERSKQAIQKINDLLTPEQRTLWAQLREKRSQPRPQASPTATPAPQG